MTRQALSLLYFLIGVALLWLVVAETDIDAVWSYSLQVGVQGLTIVLLVYLLAFVLDSISWQLALPSVALSTIWAVRLFVVRMIGEAFNTVLPAGGMGGEPVKAVLLKRYFGLGYRVSGVSLVLTKTLNLVALVLFLLTGFGLLLMTPGPSVLYKTVAGCGLLVLSLGIGLLFLMQRYRWSSSLTGYLSARPRLHRLASKLHIVEDIDERLNRFYSQHRGRLLAALLLALFNWLLGALEVYLVMGYLGQPVTFTEAWIIESAAQLMRAGAFFIPAGIGAQEGAFVLVTGALTGNPVAGLAAALVRRARELVWVAAGLLLGGLMSLRARHATD